MTLPPQVPRLAIVFALAIAALVGARSFLVPASFGRFGHYRAVAVDSIAARPIHYAGRQECEECHDAIAAERIRGNHRGVACEVCHGPQAAHVTDPVNVQPPAPRDRAFCPRCHAYSQSRPTGFPPIDPAAHNPLKPCITCHDPHASVLYDNPVYNPNQGLNISCETCHPDEAANQKSTAMSLLDIGCTGCHMPPMVRSADANPSIHTADMSSHLWEINLEPGVSQFSPDGTETMPYLTVEYVCLRCHTDGGGAHPMSIGQAETYSVGYHE